MQKPNVILCMCDQLRAHSVGCYGDRVVQTPRIDRLAEQGARFETAVTNNPVCTPARSILLSGQYSRTCTGMVGNMHADRPSRSRSRLVSPTLAEMFRQNGYRTALIGKWHIDPDPALIGFDSAVYPRVEHRYFGQTYFDDPAKEGFVVGEFGPEFEAKRLSAFLSGCGNEPFFLFYSISQPHPPIGPGNLPEKYDRMYAPDKVPIRPNAPLRSDRSQDREWFKIYTIWDYWWRVRWRKQEPKPGDALPPDFDLRHLTAWYYGAVTCVDDQVGRLMDMLREHGLIENTLVVFTSDHGDNLGSHGRFNKDVLLEESIRIPLIFWWPARIKAQVNTRQIAQLIDVMPTLLDLCALPAPDGRDGRSLAALLDGGRAELPCNVAYIETGSYQVGIRTLTHLYGMGFDPQSREITNDRLCFFDLKQDPLQQHNLAATAGQAQMDDELRQRLRQWHEHTPWLNTNLFSCGPGWK
ncbi:MAG: sulfatase-like hydrolase/transferase [Lentisphaerae bacterium]|nr:sulfatase-like hydrolase/transferase [Lentisphaerota bacterium]